jgi:hypothetical protein
LIKIDYIFYPQKDNPCNGKSAVRSARAGRRTSSVGVRSVRSANRSLTVRCRLTITTWKKHRHSQVDNHDLEEALTLSKTTSGGPCQQTTTRRACPQTARTAPPHLAEALESENRELRRRADAQRRPETHTEVSLLARRRRLPVPRRVSPRETSLLSVRGSCLRERDKSAVLYSSMSVEFVKETHSALSGRNRVHHGREGRRSAGPRLPAGPGRVLPGLSGAG